MGEMGDYLTALCEAEVVTASVACKWGDLEEPVFGLPPEDVRVSLCYHVSAADAASMRAASAQALKKLRVIAAQEEEE